MTLLPPLARRLGPLSGVAYPVLLGVLPPAQPPARPAAQAGSRLMRSEFLHFAPPLIGEEEIDEVVRTLRGGGSRPASARTSSSRSFGDYVGAPAALAVNSATSAMHIALAALGIGEGDAVVSTTMTFASTIHVIEHQRARPVLVDVEPDTLNIDPDQVEAAVRRRPESRRSCRSTSTATRPRWTPIYDIARRHGLAVIEDAAHALPARYHGRMIGAPSRASTSRTSSPSPSTRPRTSPPARAGC